MEPRKIEILTHVDGLNFDESYQHCNWFELTNFEVPYIDFEDLIKLESAMKDVSIVYHFAGLADIGESKKFPYKTIESNVMGLTKVLEIAVKSSVMRFVFASTINLSFSTLIFDFDFSFLNTC